MRPDLRTVLTTKTDSAGVGLSISRSIIETHEGRLWHPQNRSEEGGGTTFFFTVPHHPAAS